MTRHLKVTLHTTWIHVTFIYLLFFLSGCTQNYAVKSLDADLTSSIIEPLPLKIGVYYPNELRAYSYTYTYGGDHVFHLGESSVILFNKLLSEMFKNVVEVEGTNGSGQPDKDLDAIIEFNIWYAHFSFASSSVFDELTFSYRTDLYTPSGKLLTSWDTDASGLGPGKGLVLRHGARTAMENALNNAAKDFVVSCRMELAKYPSLFLKD
jgi:hypothetical protein